MMCTRRMLWECHRFEEERREFLSGDVSEDVRLGLREAMENECSRSKLHIPDYEADCKTKRNARAEK